MSETGAVKFTFEQVAAETIPFSGLADLNACRRKLLQLRLIGTDENGTGFGNLSVRNGATNSFYVTGSGMGGLPRLESSDVAKVIAYDFQRNWLSSAGTAIASSESLTHAAVYENAPKAMAVIHCHSVALWSAFLERVPTTAREVAYGTPEMAGEVGRLFGETDVAGKKIFVMAGHEGGIVSFGGSLDEAFGNLISALRLTRGDR